ncbi:glycosyltransferase family 2 protein [Methanococcoides sp. SA1]|nr:glycosyltransferase family 2 protein [Methanococcoides sp. SA1]
MSLRKYIIVTPCKNEDRNLCDVAQSLINQTILPVLWVIVNDNSTDKTPAIVD